MPFVTAIPTLALAANRVTNLVRPPGASGRPPTRPPRLGDLEVCTQTQQAAITHAFNEIHVWHVPVVRNAGGDWVTLADMMLLRSVASVTISCNLCSGSPYISSDVAKQSLQVCAGFGNTTSDRQWLQSLIVIELVRLCGGTNLDAYAVKNFIFNVNRTSSPYSYFSVAASEKALMCLGGTKLPSPWGYLAGKFTVWDNVGGRLWPSTRSGGVVQPYGQSLIPFNVGYLWQHAC